jgi:hypothetical protein
MACDVDTPRKALIEAVMSDVRSIKYAKNN